MKPVMTKKGLIAMIRGMSGEQLTFTKIALGCGEEPSSKNAEDAVKMKEWKENIPIDSTVVESSGDYLQINAIYTNENNDDFSYNWTEVGIYCSCGDDEDEFMYQEPRKDILYAYGHYKYDGDGGATIRIPKKSNEIFELRFRYHVFVSGASQVSDDVVKEIEEKYVAEHKAMWEHIYNYNNPHKTTAAQIGIKADEINEVLNIKNKKYEDSANDENSSENELSSNNSTIIYYQGDHEVEVDESGESLVITNEFNSNN